MFIDYSLISIKFSISTKMDFTEPMTLGSPFSSPKQSNSPPQTGLQSSKMLPSYLIGDTTLPSKSPKSNHLFSSPRSTEHTSPHFRLLL